MSTFKIRCEVCGHEAHNLRIHFKDEAEKICKASYLEYVQQFPDAPIWSDAYVKKLEQVRGHGLTEILYDTEKAFGVPFGRDNKIMGFAERTEYVPPINPDFVFPVEHTKIVFLALRMNKPMMLIGPTGSGKTDLVQQVAARLNWPCLTLGHFRDMYSFHIMGQPKVINKQTVFLYGPLPFSMQRTMILILDEWDALDPGLGFIYQKVLEKRPDGRLGNLIIPDNGNEVILAHRNFRIFATSNTNGIENDRGLYQGTQVQNISFSNRFQIKQQVGYLPKEVEIQMLTKKYPTLSDFERPLFVDVANRVREQFAAGELNLPFSIRDLFNWVDMYQTTGGHAVRAIKLAYTNILPFEDAKVVEELVQRTFGS